MHKNGLIVIVFNGICWLNEKHMAEQLSHANLVVITRRYHPKYRKDRHQLIDNPKNQPNRIFLHRVIAIGVIKDCRTAEACNFKRSLGFELHDVFNTKRQIVVETLKDVFEGENIQTKYYVLGYRVDLYFHDYKLAIETDEFRHCDRDIEYEKERERILKEELNCVFIRINPDKPNFNVNNAKN